MLLAEIHVVLEQLVNFSFENYLLMLLEAIFSFIANIIFQNLIRKSIWRASTRTQNSAFSKRTEHKFLIVVILENCVPHY